MRFLAVASAAALLCTGFCACSDDDDDDAPDNSTPEYSVTGKLNGHEYVDLGLSVKWAACNIGANSPFEYGDYFAWGETSTKAEYTESNSLTEGKSVGNISGNATYDAARAKWGDTWRLPTESEITELINKCDWDWVTQGGVKCYQVTGANGNSIFLPAAGWCYGTTVFQEGNNGFYWSSQPSGDNASCLFFSNGFRSSYWAERYNGLPVRPVSD